MAHVGEKLLRSKVTRMGAAFSLSLHLSLDMYGTGLKIKFLGSNKKTYASCPTEVEGYAESFV